jgi:competence protein ComEA
MTTLSFAKIVRRTIAIVALGALVLAMGGTWMTSHTAHASPPAPAPAAPAVAASPAALVVASTVPNRDLDEDHGSKKPVKKELTGKLNLNAATAEQLLLLPTVGPSKAERIIEWRKRNGGFKRVVDLRRVKGFGYKTFKKLEPLLDIKGDTTLAVKH